MSAYHLFSSPARFDCPVELVRWRHFENLGLYEMVLRRCHYIVVSDAGQDPECSFADLGEAVRKIRIDFGIPIEFGAMSIYSRSQVDARKAPRDRLNVLEFSCHKVDPERINSGSVKALPPTRGDILRLARFGSCLGACALLTLTTCGKKEPIDEAKAAGLTTADFPQIPADIFKPMDGGIDLSPEEIMGRNTWNLWSGGNQHFWNRAAQDSYGLMDLLIHGPLAVYPPKPLISPRDFAKRLRDWRRAHCLTQMQACMALGLPLVVAALRQGPFRLWQ